MSAPDPLRAGSAERRAAFLPPHNVLVPMPRGFRRFKAECDTITVDVLPSGGRRIAISRGRVVMSEDLTQAEVDHLMGLLGDQRADPSIKASSLSETAETSSATADPSSAAPAASDGGFLTQDGTMLVRGDAASSLSSEVAYE